MYPQNASLKLMRRSCEASLKRLRTDRLDLYLLHWRGSVPLAQTVQAFAQLQQAGLIRHWGVSNLDMADMRELCALPGAQGGQGVQTNQLLYNLSRRGIEFDLLPWLRQRGIPTMAYSPIEQGRLAGNKRLADFSKRHGITPAQAALAWLAAQPDVIAIPKTGNRKRLQENFDSLQIGRAHV